MIRSTQIGLGVILPLIFFPIVLDPVQWPRAFYLSVFSLVLIFLAMKGRMVLGRFSLFLFGFLVLQGASLIWSFNFSETLSDLARYFSIFCVLVTVESLLVEKKMEVTQLLYIFVRSSVVLMVIGFLFFILFFNWNEGTYTQQAIASTMANKNLLGAALWFGLFAALRLRLASKWNSTTSLIIFVTSVGTWLYLIDSRAVLIASSVVLGHFLFFLFTQKRLFSSEGALAQVLLVAFVLSAVFSIKGEVQYQQKQAEGNVENTVVDFKGESFVPKKLASVYRTNTDDPSSVFTRLYLWKNSLILWLEHPLLGTGAGTWRLLIPKVGLEDYAYKVENGWVFYSRPHNEFVRLLVELGIVGMLSFVGIIVFTIKGGLRSLWNEKFKFLSHPKSIFGTGVMAFSFILFMDFSLERPLTLLFFMLLLLAAMYTFEEGKKKVPISPIVLLIFPIVAMVVSGFKVQGEYELKQAMIHRARLNWPTYSLKTADIGNVFYQIDPYSFPVEWQRATALFHNGQFEQANLKYMECAEVAPYNLNVLNDLASSFYNLGEVDSALKYYTRALEISPRFEEALINKSAILFNAGKVEDSFATIKRAYLFSTHANYRPYLQAICVDYMEKLKLSENESTLQTLNKLTPVEFHKLYKISDGDLESLLKLVAEQNGSEVE